MGTERTESARAYYRAIDGGAYDRLADLLAPEFVHRRPDRTLDGRERFVRFMREERPMTDTEHAVDAVYRDAGEVAVRGRLLRDGDALFEYVDVFSFADAGAGEREAVAEIRTYTR